MNKPPANREKVAVHKSLNDAMADNSMATRRADAIVCMALRKNGLDPRYVHMGEGIFLVVMNVPTPWSTNPHDPPHVAVSPREDWDGGVGFMVGVYRSGDDTGEWPDDDAYHFCDNVDELPALVREGMALIAHPNTTMERWAH